MNGEISVDMAGAPKAGPGANEFIKSLGQSAKAVALYQSSHPIASAALAETLRHFERICAGSVRDHLTLSLIEDRWLVNGSAAAEASQAPEVLRTIFRAHGLSSLSFGRGLHAFELAAFGELSALAPSKSDKDYLADFLSQRGVKNIRPNAEIYAKAQGKPPAAAPPLTADSFGGLLKRLVESAIADPAERNRIYGDALRLVRQALDRHVREATVKLREEKDRVVREQERAEQVLSTVAEGKVIVDSAGKVLMMNAAAEEISGHRLAEIAGKPITESVDPSEQIVSLSRDLEGVFKKNPSREVRVLAEDAVEQAFRQSIALIQDEAGHLVGTYSVLPSAAQYKENVQTQREFVSRVTHELNAPLASIIAGLGILADKLKGGLAADEERFLTACRRNSERLRLMIRDILDFSKLQAGKLSAQLAPCPVDAILKESVEGMRPWAQMKKIELAAEKAPEGLPKVTADHARIVQVLTNLVSNAIKATPAGGRIAVSAAPGLEQHAGAVVFAVKDTGCGIAKENMTRIFEKFVHIAGETQYREGVGLGLTIVKDLLSLHQGTLWVESEEGRGTTFFFTLPVAAGAPPESPAGLA